MRGSSIISVLLQRYEEAVTYHKKFRYPVVQKQWLDVPAVGPTTETLFLRWYMI